MKNAMCNEVLSLMAGTNGTSGTASLKIYSGAQPASADDGAGTSGTMLCQIDNIGWNLGTSGTSFLASTSGYQGTASDAGSAGWARMETVNGFGTCRIDGDCGIVAGNVFTLNINEFSTGGLVTLLSADIYMA
jgi:hypothetical protein